MISRVVTRTVLGRDQEAHWNVVQNNGESPSLSLFLSLFLFYLFISHTIVIRNSGTRAAQVVPHIHFHIIPRPADNASSSSSNTTAAARSPSWTMFGRGQREELDDEEGEKLARLMREELAREVKRIKDEEGIDLDLDDDNDNNGDYRNVRDVNGTVTTKGRGLEKL